MKLTIVYITGRNEPCVNWIVDDLARQIRRRDEIDLVVIDTQNRSREALGIDPKPFEHVVVSAPKPSIWQGPHRVTSVDWWANSNARNTGIALCKTDFVAFLDDRCHLGPYWLDSVRQAEERQESVVVGAYQKIENDRTVLDHRFQQCPEGKINCGGSWLYGCTFALPLRWCLEVNGFEEGCDGLSGEDYIFGFMLENNGRRIDFMPSMFVTLERSAPHANTFFRADKGISPNDKSHAAMDRFRPRKTTEFTPDLKAIRKLLSRDKPFPIPDPQGDYRDWYDGEPIRNAVPPTSPNGGMKR